MDCDMCGREQATLKASVEGTVLAVCNGCSRYGKLVGKIPTAVAAAKEKAKADKQKPEEEELEAVVANFGVLIKQKRESLGLKQEEFAKKIAVKESVLHKMETGTLKPSVEEAKRISKVMGIKLVEKAEAVEDMVPQQKKDQLTLGDMIKIKKK
jgi:putative transcription factor